MRTLTIWITATRPKTLIASVCPVCVGAALAFPVSWVLFFSLLSTALGIQVVCNFANDYFDGIRGADTVDRKGPLRVTAEGLVSPQSMNRALFLCTLTTLVPGYVLIVRGGPLFGALIALSLALAYLYTCGPWPLAYLGLGEFFVFVFFGPVAVGCTFFLLTLKWALTPFLIGLVPGALSTALLVINNLRDVDEDRATGKKTLIVRLGMGFGKGEVIVCLLITLVVPLILLESRLVALGMAFPSLHFIKQIVQAKNPFDYSLLLPKMAKLLFLFTLLFVLFWDF